jgi:hypothetical protein
LPLCLSIFRRLSRSDFWRSISMIQKQKQTFPTIAFHFSIPHDQISTSHPSTKFSDHNSSLSSKVNQRLQSTGPFDQPIWHWYLRSQFQSQKRHACNTESVSDISKGSIGIRVWEDIRIFDKKDRCYKIYENELERLKRLIEKMCSDPAKMGIRMPGKVPTLCG